ncbi:VOC family protein [Phenylobacterium sp.]|jgi:uncharacterized glyoxalase superfamily protein PhnB|uniref:VOC family protein n=1 Tax=Phenylobacterium sp. TaxID=1871053 RepID=UPI002E30BE93|nr:VOC family protein [Phenylobacterium sp.]HEX2558963.1 VOC family protein [Phenylobacterium sp.]
MTESVTHTTPAAAADFKSPLTPTAFYRNPRAALEWLEQAFGFEVSTLLTDAEGNIAHAEMAWRGANIGVAGEWTVGRTDVPARALSPSSIDHVITQFVWVEVDGDIDVHCARAKAAGARIIEEPKDQFYGARTYRALDLEGHVWNFRQELRQVSFEEMEAATGLKFQNTGRS